MEELSSLKITYTVKCGWWTGRRILKLVKKYDPLTAFRTGINEITFTVEGIDNDEKQDIYKLPLQNGAKIVTMQDLYSWQILYGYK
jgi:hypothetical protein